MPRRIKKLVITLSVLLLFLVISALTNPTKEDYITFDEAETGLPQPESARIAEANFLFFSLYTVTPRNTVDEYGIVHLGFIGHFFKVTDGQYDDSIWKVFLK